MVTNKLISLKLSNRTMILGSFSMIPQDPQR
jgi:hypothetical protein